MSTPAWRDMPLTMPLDYEYIPADGPDARKGLSRAVKAAIAVIAIGWFGFTFPAASAALVAMGAAVFIGDLIANRLNDRDADA